MSPTGSLLLSKRGDDGRVSIWSRGLDGTTKKLTAGRADVGPDFSKDGRSWVYADYAQKSIMLCSTVAGTCRVLRRDEQLPTWPRFSPDGGQVAYLTQIDVPRLIIVSAEDGRVEQSWDAYWQCPPIWSSSTTLWNFETVAQHYYWFERDTLSGKKTGNRLEVANDNVGFEEVKCWPTNVSRDSPFFQPVRIETKEITKLLRLHGAGPTAKR